MKDSDILKALASAKRFVFWSCPNNCNGIVAWNADFTVATCKTCGRTSA